MRRDSQSGASRSATLPRIPRQSAGRRSTERYRAQTSVRRGLSGSPPTSWHTFRTIPASLPRSCSQRDRLRQTLPLCGFHSGPLHRPAVFELSPVYLAPLSGSHPDKRQARRAFPCQRTDTSGATISRRLERLPSTDRVHRRAERLCCLAWHCEFSCQ